MEVIPAIDIRGGRAVRLRQGDYAQETVYEDDPLDAARRWVEQGAAMLHVVDLDGARGDQGNLHSLRRIAGLGVPVQFGGGLRTTDAVGAAVDAGADRVVVGTAAYRDERFVERAVEAFGERLAVAVDVKGGRVAVAGWLETEDAGPVEVLARFSERGVTRFVVTSVDRDGMLDGPDLELARAADGAGSGELVYSGGVSSVADLSALAELRLASLTGVITGKALYEGRFTLAEAREAVA